MANEEGEEIYGYYYGEDEDRGLLDPAWERQQKKVSPFSSLHFSWFSWPYYLLRHAKCLSNKSAIITVFNPVV